jgi:hypothetical protein
VPDITNVVGVARQAIGPYFSVVSVVPSAALVMSLAFLIASGSWQHNPHWSQAAHDIAGLGLGGVGLLALASLTIGVLLHPLQFAFVQTLEGYWGIGTAAQWLRQLLIRRHVGRREALDQLSAIASASLRPQHADQGMSDAHSVRVRSLRDEADRLLTNYPDSIDGVMPTSLGNVLRRYEMAVGRPYGLDAPTVVPYIALVAPAEHMAYVNDQRSTLDLAVRGAVTSLMIFVVSVAFLWNDRLWLLLALVPYTATYACYRGAVVSAHHYGVAVATLIALNRFTLYERLHLPLPGDTERERKQGDEWMSEVLPSFEKPSLRIRFRHPTKPL